VLRNCRKILKNKFGDDGATLFHRNYQTNTKETNESLSDDDCDSTPSKLPRKTPQSRVKKNLSNISARKPHKKTFETKQKTLPTRSSSRKRKTIG